MMWHANYREMGKEFYGKEDGFMEMKPYQHSYLVDKTCIKNDFVSLSAISRIHTVY